MFLYTSLVFVAFVAVAEVECYSENIFKESNGMFLTRFYDAVFDSNGNKLISPLSLNYALTALSFGTSGNSLSQLRTALNQPDGPEAEKAILQSYKIFTESLMNDDNMTLATKLYLDHQFPAKNTYKSILINNFDADFEHVNFRSEPERARKNINQFVDIKTNHLIPVLFDEDSIRSDTKTVLVNAVYFKSQWKSEFSSRDTHKKLFYGLDRQYQVDMMSQVEYFNYGVDLGLNAQLLEIPYKGGFSFLIILPKDTYGILELENELVSRLSDPNSSPFLDIFKQTSRNYVEVNLPKFTFEETLDLEKVLKKMGVTDIFDVKANFSRLSNVKVIVDQAIQKTIIKVDEAGTEAAAATGIKMIPSSYPPQPVQFNADHPFIYIIRHDLTGTPLFAGRFSHP